MQVNDPNLHGLSSQATQGTERAQNHTENARSQNATKSGIGSDSVEISSFAQQVNDLREGSSAREARVEELRNLVQSGRYEVDGNAVASRIVDELLGEK